MAITAELKAKWVEALRSGEFAQGKYNLFDGTGYCCLGVLCKVQGQIVPVGDLLDNKLRTIGHEYTIGSPKVKVLYERVVQDLGSDAKGALTTMNDRGDSFDKIAQWIENNVEVAP